MSHAKETCVALESALSRILSGDPIRCSPDRKLSVSAVEYEAELANGSAYYYPELVQKIKMLKKRHLSNLSETAPKTTNQKYLAEKKIKEKYREQVTELRQQVSQMATEHHQFNSDLIRACKKIKDQEDEIAKLRRERMVLVKPLNSALAEKGESQ